MRWLWLLAFVCHFAVADDNVNSEFEKRRPWFESRGLVSSTLTAGQPEHINQLIFADSPYLLSHALQPIDWLPWSDSVLAQAEASQKLIYLSIGYDTCHWCHVLASESYTDQQVAALLNQHFINIKIDRELSPDIDAKYRVALETMSGNPGWPIQVILTPTGHILWIDSYQPKAALLNIWQTLAEKWHTNPNRVSMRAKSLDEQLLGRGTGQNLSTDATSLLDGLSLAVSNILQTEQEGRGPRFLRANWLLLLLDQYAESQDVTKLALVKEQIRQLLTSPTYDVIDGGMHRYAEDGKWQEPHFEKMLYDQALLIRVLARLYALTGESEYLYFAEQTVAFVEQNMATEGHYASSLSAISDGVEGAFYRFSQEDVADISGLSFSSDSSLMSLSTFASPPSKALSLLGNIRRTKVRPFVDGKAILAWNALYTLALADLYHTTLIKKYADKVIQQALTMQASFVRPAGVFRIVFDGRHSIPAKLDDYAFLIQAFIAADTLAPEQQFIADAERLAEMMKDTALQQSFVGMTSDTQLPSMAGSVAEAFKQLYLATGDKKYKESLGALKARAFMFNEDVNQLSLARGLSISEVPFYSPVFFGLGHGTAYFQRDMDQLFLVLSLEDGWHINSNVPFDDKLVPTRVQVISDKLVEPSRFEFPPAIEKRVSFNQHLLKLFEGDIKIKVNTSLTEPKRLSVQLQVCSERLCLLPERLILVVPPQVAD